MEGEILLRRVGIITCVAVCCFWGLVISEACLF